MSNADFYLFIVEAILFLLLGFALGNGMDYDNEEKEIKEMRQEAIKRGLAKYVIIDESTGDTEFQWIEDSNKNT